MVPHFKKTDAVRRRGAAASVERRETELVAERVGDCVCVRRLALTERLKELQCFTAWGREKERGRERERAQTTELK